jgi:hypothetical protein
MTRCVHILPGDSGEGQVSSFSRHDFAPKLWQRGLSIVTTGLDPAREVLSLDWDR